MSEERIGPYRILELIAQSSQAVSYRALHVHLDREVFLKVLPEFGADADERRTRFMQEARALARIDHPAVVRVYDSGEYESRLYLASELLDGPDLQTQLLTSGPFSWDEIHSLADVLLQGLGAVHDAGIIHRDIKPSNIVLNRDGPKLADFGLARIIDNPQGTRTDSFLGTPAYIAPELLKGATAGPASDLFALGATLYELHSGKRAFSGDTFQAVLTRILEHDPLSRLEGGATSDRGKIFLSALLMKDPSSRPPTASEAARLLSQKELKPQTTSPEKRLRLSMVSTALAVAIIAGVLLWPREVDFEPHTTSTILADSSSITDLGIMTGRESTPPDEKPEKTEESGAQIESEKVSLHKETETYDSMEHRAAAVGASNDEADTEEQLIDFWVQCTPWAEIVVDGVVCDTTPIASPLHLEPGVHFLTFKHPSYLPITVELNASLANSESLHISMAESTAFIRISSDPWASITMDGMSLGTTPFADLFRVRPGAHVVAAHNPYQGDREKEIVVAPAETAAVLFSFGHGME